MKKTALKLANVIGETGIFRVLYAKRIPVFMLHRFHDASTKASSSGMSAGVLRSYLKYLAKHGYQVLRMEELWEKLDQGEVLPNKSVMFTIDDGFSDHFDVAASVFEEFGFPLNFFVITGFLDQDLWPWDDQITYALHNTPRKHADLIFPSGVKYSINLVRKDAGATAQDLRSKLKTENQTDLYGWLRGEYFRELLVEYPSSIPSEFRPMSWGNARSLRATGHGVYPHTWSHRILSKLSAEERKCEIDRSVARVEGELNYRPDVFAYPTGRLTDYDQADVERLKLAGIKMAFNTVPGYVDGQQSMYELPRFSLPSRFDDFRQIVNRFEALKMRLRR